MDASPTGSLQDRQGNSYGIVRITGPGATGSAPRAALESVVLYANAKVGTVHGRGRTIRLKPHSGHGHCRQNLPGTELANLLDGSMSDCDEMINGYDGNDILIGGSGSNTLTGGRGADFMTGGGGADRFVYERASDSAIDAVDVVTDFNDHDILDLGGVARTTGQPLTFIGFNEFTGVPGQVNYSLIEYWKCDPDWHCKDSYFTMVQADLTGSGTADFCINLLGRQSLQSRNFVLGPSGNRSRSS